jgi:prophage DNA circulation protein
MSDPYEREAAKAAIKVLQRELAEAKQKEAMLINTIKNDRYVRRQEGLQIERELAEALKQRDELAEALENLLVTEGRGLDEWEREAFRQAKEALAAVKGGNNE